MCAEIESNPSYVQAIALRINAGLEQRERSLSLRNL
jgi:hypothetical protein